jgi:N-acetylneuraminic acid mutarotase
MGVAAVGNVPGGRMNSISWIDPSGNLWLFGGYGSDSTGVVWDHLNDLWKYSPSSGQWTWISGSKTVNASGSYGTMGVAAIANVPGARIASVAWADTTGNLWLFGGIGYPPGGAFGALNDLWKYSPSAGQWTWISGSNAANTSGSYGTMGTPGAGNFPGARGSSVSWIDASGNLWLFGGGGYAAAGYGSLNDLWKYSPSSSQWTWVSGSSDINAVGSFGTMGTAAAGNVPGARNSSVAWIDASDNLWLLGGSGSSSTSANANFNDLWKYSPSTGLWTWVSGSNGGDASGTYGTLGTPGVGNVPGGRSSPISWVDTSGNLWLFGGLGRDSMGMLGNLNDLWRY